MPNWNSALIPISTQNKNSTGVSALAWHHSLKCYKVSYKIETKQKQKQKGNGMGV